MCKYRFVYMKYEIAPSAQIKPNKDSVIILCGDDLMAAVPPQVDPHPVSHRQQHGAADAGHLAAVVGKAGVVHRSQALPVLEYGTLSPSTHRHVHGEVVKTLQGAREDARVGAVGLALVGQHVHQLEDARVVGGAVGPVQPGGEGHHPPCSDEDRSLEGTLDPREAFGLLGGLTWWGIRVNDLPLFLFFRSRFP